MICPEYTQIRNSRQGSLFGGCGDGGFGVWDWARDVRRVELAPASGNFCTGLVRWLPAWERLQWGKFGHLVDFREQLDVH